MKLPDLPTLSPSEITAGAGALGVDPLAAGAAITPVVTTNTSATNVFYRLKP